MKAPNKFAFSRMFIPGLLSISPATVLACHLDSGVQAFQDGRLDAAKAALEQCQNQQPAKTNFYLGLIARKQNQLPLSETRLKMAYGLEPSSEYGLELAVTEEWQGKLEAARSIYRKVLRQDPGSIPGRLGLARIERWLGYLANASRLYKGILREQPDNLEAQNGLAFIAMYDKKVYQAKRQFTAILQAHPDNEEAKTGLKQLAEVRRYEILLKDRINQTVSGNTAHTTLFNVKADLSAKLSLEGELTHTNKRAGSITLTPYDIDRDIKDKASIGAIFKTDNQNSVSVTYDHLNMFDESTQHRAKFEFGHNFNKHDRYFIGVQPTLSDGSVINNLSYGGIVKGIGEKHEVQVQLFHATDVKNPDGKAISVTAYGYPDEQKSWLLGASYGVSGDTRTTLLHAEVDYNVTDNASVMGGFKINPDTSEKELEIGLRWRQL